MYTKPSLGGIEAFFEYSSIDRPQFITVNGLPRDDRTVVTTYGARYQRSVGTLVTLDLTVGRTHAGPKLFFIPGYTGITYGGGITYERSSAGSIKLGFNHSVSAQGNVGTSYYINSSVDASISLRASSRISTSAAVTYGTRRFRGEDNDLPNGPRGNDKLFNINASAGYRVNSKLSFTMNARYKVRNSQNEFYDYSSTQATLGASFHL